MSPQGTDRHTPVRPERRKARDRRSRGGSALWRKRTAWALALAGAVLFLASSLGTSLGIAILPFDQHHVLGQAGGLLLAILALGSATR